MRQLALLALALFAATAAARAEEDCLPANAPDAVAEGELRIEDDAFILELSEAICLEGEGDFDNVEPTRRVHIAPQDEKMVPDLKKLVGKTITVTGDMFGSHTQHHKAPIVMLITDASAK